MGFWALTFTGLVLAAYATFSLNYFSACVCGHICKRGTAHPDNALASLSL